ncbi:MAG TPA: alpha/beta fold hydrolase [Jatrophihabitantaceae bacterium]
MTSEEHGMTRYLPHGTRLASHAAIRVFCFPFAGGGASAYARWSRRLGPGVAVLPVQLPGREGRMAEPRFTDVDELINDLDDALDADLDHPHVFYGHSMGALLAYALARRRAEQGKRLPQALVLSAYRAPHLPAPYIANPDASDAEIVTALVGLGGIPQTLLDHPEWLSILLPIVRDDLRMCSGHIRGPYRPLPVPVHTFAGDTDRLVTPAEVHAWRQHTSDTFHAQVVPGGHFFVRDHEEQFLRSVTAVLRQYVERPQPRAGHTAAPCPRALYAAS